MLANLQQDHLNIAKLLKVLEQKLELIKEGQSVKYQLIADIVTYLSEFSDKTHHPKEDMIYDYYVKYRLVEEDISNQLGTQHKALTKMTEELSEVLEIILMDAVVPLDQFAERLGLFVEAQWAHLNYEEEVIFPLLKTHLTPDDWRLLEQQWHHGDKEDPLFSHNVQAQYKVLAERIAASDTPVEAGS